MRVIAPLPLHTWNNVIIGQPHLLRCLGMPLDDHFCPNHVFAFLCVLTEVDGYIRKTLDSPFLILKIAALAQKTYGKIQTRYTIEIWASGAVLSKYWCKHT